MENKKYFIGLDIGTDSVGYAVTDTSDEYNLIKHGGEPMWGVSLFDEAELCDTRRAKRVERRRLDRRQQRVKLVQELFASEIAKVDAAFYKRISESALLREDGSEPYCLFNDIGFTDKEYHKQYPTIHHLICELMDNKARHDVRLVYIACAWLVAHRGHFLSDVSIDNVSSLRDFKPAYNELISYFEETIKDEQYEMPWSLGDDGIKKFSEIIKWRRITDKTNALCELLFNGKKPKKEFTDGTMFPFNVMCIIKLLSGSDGVKVSELFINPEYEDLEKVSLAKNEEHFEEVLAGLGDDAALLVKLKAIYDWSVLSDILNDKSTISESKVEIYGRHKKDLDDLKKYVRANYDRSTYLKIFKNIEENNYTAYSGKAKKSSPDYSKYKKCNSAEDFCKYLETTLKLSDKKNVPDGMLERIQNGDFMPKQVNGDNRVIPYQLYYDEMRKILDNASGYLPFLNEKDEYGTVKDKLLSVMKFRVPYYVGPLNPVNNEHAWIVRKADGKIYPWNFTDKVDLDKSEQEFINRMTNTCSYIAGEDVLPQKSLLYEKFEVLNEINNIKLYGKPILPEVKQAIYTSLFLKKKKVSFDAIIKYLITNNIVKKEDAECISGIDKDIKSSLSSHVAFSRLMQNGILSADDVESIILRRTYSEDNSRFRKWLKNNYSNLSDSDISYITGLPIKDFGRLSKQLLDGIIGGKVDIKTGERSDKENTVINIMWESNVNLSELLLSDEYSFKRKIEKLNKEYYNANPKTLSDRLDDMFVSNAVKRPIIRTLDIVSDVVKASGGRAPEKIFVEMARGTKENLKGKRTQTRKEQILELYSKIKNDDVRELKAQLDSYGDNADNKLQSDRLFLYYMQLGKSMYLGTPIEIENLSSTFYDIDHIYPQSFVKDDSILNNKVLVLSSENGAKGNRYPIDSQIRSSMQFFWDNLKKYGLITEEKYKRLTRNTPFTEEEKWGFINRQLVETRQSTKAVAELLKEKYPDTKIVYVKAGLVSDFRHEYGMLKSRSVNDLHHAKDAYLNIVCGNVYNEKFTRQWFLGNSNSDNYSIGMKALFGHKQIVNGKSVWKGEESIGKIKKTVSKNNCHQMFYSVMKKHGQNGGFFNQMPRRAGMLEAPLKAGLDVKKYGGYDGLTTSFTVLVKYKLGKKSIIEFVPVVLLEADKFLNDSNYAIEYVKKKIPKAEDIELLLDGRPIKIGTIVEVDGLRLLIGGQGSKNDTRMGVKVFSPLTFGIDTEQYIKSVESFNEKIAKNVSLKYSPDYDTVTREKNIELYGMLIDKLSNSVYKNRPTNQCDKLKKAYEKFAEADIKEQCASLINILTQFNRATLDDKLTSADKNCRLSANVMNWGYEKIYIIDMSPSGIWEKKSVNLLEL